MKLDILQNENSITFSVKAVPGSSRTSIEGMIGGMLKVKLASPPEKGKANKELVRLLSETLKMRKNDIEIVSGQSSPVKQVRILGCCRDLFIKAIGC